MPQCYVIRTLRVYSSSSAALQPGVGFVLLNKLTPLLSISSQLLPILHLKHFHIFEDSFDPSILGILAWMNKCLMNNARLVEDHVPDVRSNVDGMGRSIKRSVFLCVS